MKNCNEKRSGLALLMHNQLFIIVTKHLAQATYEKEKVYLARRFRGWHCHWLLLVRALCLGLITSWHVCWWAYITKWETGGRLGFHSPFWGTMMIKTFYWAAPCNGSTSQYHHPGDQPSNHISSFGNTIKPTSNHSN